MMRTGSKRKIRLLNWEICIHQSGRSKINEPPGLMNSSAFQAGAYREMQSSIQYAKRIQEAMMLKEKHLLRLFPQSFILFMPRDVVSGDFYWFTKINNKILVAVADCTGHGIPGAFMSVLGINLLSQIIIEEQNTDPSFILQRLDHKVKKALSHSGDTSDQISNDGMDISLCCIDPGSCQVTFSGALRSVLHIDSHGINEIRGSRYPIGGLDLEDKRTYENHTFSFKNGDKLYMFSDGYADQFGGTNNKKLMAKRLKDILSGLSHRPMSLQSFQLKKVFNEWKGQADQTDDVLVVGLEL